MADHLRAQIRAAAVTALGGLPTTGARVYDSPVDALQESQLPGLAVFTDDESEGLATIGGALLDRELVLLVEIYVKKATGYAAQADQIAKEVEAALGSDPTLGGLAKHMRPTAWSAPKDAAIDLPVVAARITFTLFYYTALGVPDVAR